MKTINILCKLALITCISLIITQTAFAQNQRVFNGCAEIRTFVNGFSEYTDIPTGKNNAGCARNDRVTKLQICRLAGYYRVAAHKSGRWHSCGDNTNGYWDHAKKDFVIQPACKARNYADDKRENLDGLTCIDKITQCNDDKDNDNDGLIDLNDPGCDNLLDNDEQNGKVAQCRDGKDNDGDKEVDALVLDNGNKRQKTFGIWQGKANPAHLRNLLQAESDKKKLGYNLRDTRSVLMRAYTPGEKRPRHNEGGNLNLPHLKRICQDFGYSEYVSSTARDSERSHRYPKGKTNWHSGGDNGHYIFKNGTFVNHRPGYYRTHLASITCKNQLPACSDKLDNDADGLVDMKDPGCANKNDTSELTHDSDCKNPNDDDESTDIARVVTISPEGTINDTTPTYKWKKANGAEFHELYVSKKATPGTPLFTKITSRLDYTRNTPLAPGDYSFWVRGLSSPNKDKVGPWSVVKHFTVVTQCTDGKNNDPAQDSLIDKEDPGCWTNPNNPNSYDPTRDRENAVGFVGKTTLINPANGSILYNRKPTFNWKAVKGATNYRFYLRHIEGKNPHVDFTPSGTSFTPINDLPLGNYRWKVRAYGAGGYLGEWSETFTFVVTSQCSDGINNDPAQDSVIDKADPGCWTNPNDPKTYDANRNRENEVGFVGKTTLINPTNGSTLYERKPTFTWKAVKGAQQYRFYLRHLEGKNPHVDFTPSGTSFTPVNNLPLGNYRWTVKAIGAGGFRGEWSETFTFVVTSQCADEKNNDPAQDSVIDKEDPGCWTNPNDPKTYDANRNRENEAGFVGQVTLIQPINNSTLYERKPTFTWKAVDGAQQYRFYLRHLEGKNPHVDFTPSGTSFTPVNNLPLGNYRWTVKAIGAGGFRGEWSETFIFQVTSQCDDDKDNDKDGRTDLDDPGCSDKEDNSENSEPECSDNIDNDGDSLIDRKDPACWDKIEKPETYNPDRDDEARNLGRAVAISPAEKDFFEDTRSPIFTWEALNEAQKYNFYLNKPQTPQEPIEDFKVDASKTSTGINRKLAFGKYQWWVRGEKVTSKGNKTLGAWSFVKNFSIFTNRPVLIAPKGNVTTNKPKYSWEASNGAAKYEIYISKKETPETALFREKVSGLSATPDFELERGVEYSFWVRAFNDLDEIISGWSKPLHYKLQFQCDDGIDNDKDGAIDLADFSCLGEPTNNDEANPKSECQDGIDNDNDSFIDLADPGCGNNNQNNNEAGADFECSDKKDNDQDGATDLADFSCSDASDDDETNPKSECQDGLDNDNDTLIDLKDPGCANNPQNNDEGAKDFQCSDGKDNDNDGAIDLDDFSCGNYPTKDDESNPKSECQDGIDNDNDTLIDLKDPGCANNPQNNDEGAKDFQCSDGKDNDNDGAIDLDDFSCGNYPTKDDESNPKSECQDGLDNDNDTLIDLKDPGCANNPQNNDEGAKDFQCSDGKDNDNDGAIDLDDFSCGNDPTKDDESNPKSECQDGLDNDNDTLIDLKDPGCANNPQNNDEGAKDFQCSDGKDNDNDGAIDLDDFSCGNDPTKDDESNPKSECQDGIDNDNDTLIDLKDPGCANNPQNNDEGAKDFQCSDGKDNDNDGAIDLDDFSCGDDPTNNDEANPKAECQDGLDNDGDALVDLADPGCENDNPQDNDESSGTTQCQDNIDNDGDGAIDLQDYSCLNDNTKDDESTPLSECQDGLDNDGDKLIDKNDPACTTPQHNNEGSRNVQCNDGEDNDKDGAIDLEDYSCLNDITKDNEETPMSQCQDGKDNDEDTAIDANDPGCLDENNDYDPQDNFEGDGTLECFDGVDNDGDGSTDADDFSCQGDNSKDDESTPIAECQDGLDNDSDIVIDLEDPGCPTIQDNNEGDGTTECQDGFDNDGDGAIDLDDFSCEGDPTKRDESTPVAQCQNGIDDDKDGFIDLKDPGCDNNPQNNDESAKDFQCSDKIDNDKDGAIDLDDFSCGDDKTNDDESNPKSECQDGKDNDGDSLIDLADPGCEDNLQNNDESAKDFQCSDGLDNDGDDAIDLFDFSCGGDRTNDDEANPKSECQDGKDNDGDTLVDLDDPGCGNNEQNNDEGSLDFECSDGVDNDKDGATDLDDFSCGNDPTRNNESTPPSQCQDGVDNDGDTLIDLADPGCDNNAQNNNEGSADFQCSDGVDNDNDGAVDLDDFSCGGDASRDNEITPAAQCQDHLDNDGDTLIDLEDPGCDNNAQNNNEGAKNFQCSDGIDNDNDGATDLDDFSCGDDASRDNEFTPPAQCQDGVDNDMDGDIDLLDSGCENEQDNVEHVDTECNDGEDNDSDGAIDLDDFSCGNDGNNDDETNPKSECEDGIDNDDDNLIDEDDNGCIFDGVYNPQHNDESRGTSECQDKVDNDGDGATDLDDFACDNKEDDDEDDKKSQCQDGIDNDGDGYIDLEDVSCIDNNQDNDESDPQPACQDGLDNDGDGFIDAADPDCNDGGVYNPFDDEATDECASTNIGPDLAIIIGESQWQQIVALSERVRPVVRRARNKAKKRGDTAAFRKARRELYATNRRERRITKRITEMRKEVLFNLPNNEFFPEACPNLQCSEFSNVASKARINSLLEQIERFGDRQINLAERRKVASSEEAGLLREDNDTFFADSTAKNNSVPDTFQICNAK